MGSTSVTFITSTLLALYFSFTFSAILYEEPFVNATEDPDDNTLILLHVIFRHGNRTPSRTWPTDEHINETYAPYGSGQLTKGGKAFEYELGVFISDTYATFLGEDYTPDSVLAKHTNKDRTIMSAELVLAGIYPPDPSEQFSPIAWQPIPVYDGTADKAPWEAYDNCPYYAVNVDKLLESEEAQKVRAEHQEMFDKFSKYTGVENATFLDALDIFTSLQAQQDFGFDLPKWTDDLPMEDIETMSALFHELCSSKVEFQRLMEGYLLNEIVQNSILKANGSLSEDQKLFLYSGHDINVASMLNVLNLWYRHQPPFGAALFIEAHKINNVLHFKILYQNYKENAPVVLQIPTCDVLCPVDKLRDILKDKFPTDADTCKLPSSAISPYLSFSSILVVLLLTFNIFM